MDTATPLQIFRPGRHTAMRGEALDFHAADLAASAATYDAFVSGAEPVSARGDGRLAENRRQPE